MRFLFLALFILSTPLFSMESPWVQGKLKQSQVRLVSEFSSISSDTREIKFGLEFKLNKGWHIYWKNAGDVGFAPKFFISTPKNVRVSMLFPAPEKLISTGSSMAYGYHDAVTYPFIVNGNWSKGEFKASVQYLVCEVQCIPEEANFAWTFPVGEEKESAHSQKLDRIVALVPQHVDNFAQVSKNSQNQLVFKFARTDIKDLFFSFPDQKSRRVDVTKVNTDTFIVSSKESLEDAEVTAVWMLDKQLTGASSKVHMPMKMKELLWALLFAFIGGIILNFMPCVLPIIFLKAFHVVKLKEKSADKIRSSLLLTVAGILSSFLFLAFVTWRLKDLGHQVGWGFQFQNPGFLTFMVLLIFIFSMNFFGLFEIHLNSKVANSTSKWHGPFAEGVFATLLATPCSAPFLGSALTFALTQSSEKLFLIFLTMGLGLSVPYIIFAIVPLQSTRLLPMPGAWMNSLRRFLGYILLLTAIWLLYVLQQQTEIYFFFALLIGLIVIFALLREIHRGWRWALILLLSIGLLSVSVKSERVEAKATEAFSEEVLQTKLAEGKKIFLVITADWCITCKFNERTVIHTEWFEQKLKEHGAELMMIDWTRRDDVIGRFLEKNGRVGIPFAMIIDGKKSQLLPELLTRDIVASAFDAF